MDRAVNSYRHAMSSARKWGGAPEDYLPVHDFIDSSKQTLGDIRHRALYHHTLGVWLCQRIFGATIVIDKSPPGGPVARTIRVPVREVAERHILEDLGFIPTPQDWLKDTPVKTWMSGAQRRELPLSHLLRDQPTDMSVADAVTIMAPLAACDREEHRQ